jgi:hypothetical protein
MRPTPDQMLGFMAQTLLLEIGPAVADDYGQRGAQILGMLLTMVAGMLLTMVAEEWDRGAERLVEENAALRGLFAEAAPHAADAALRERLERAASSREGSLRLSALNRANDELRGLLIDLHAHLESLETDAAAALIEQIWRELRTSTERRALTAAPF